MHTQYNIFFENENKIKSNPVFTTLTYLTLLNEFYATQRRSTVTSGQGI